MEEIEVPTEHLHEHIKEAAEHSKDRWGLYLAVSTAIMAVLAALASLSAGHHSNEALISQLKASDHWAYYQAKGIKYEILHSSVAANNTEPTEEAKKKLIQYKADQQEIMDKAKEAEKESAEHLEKHINIARCVTLFQIAIAISAIAMLTQKRFLWYFSLALTVAGAVMFAIA